jgi:monooxygenase
VIEELINKMNKEIDILIIGAGLSGIGMAVHLLKNSPDRSFEIVEKRKKFGGTWDLFKYPGIRSDSDMMTFGYNFKPWNKPKTLADGASILNYMEEVIEEYQLGEKIHYQYQVMRANYSRKLKKWIVEICDDQNNIQTYLVNFLVGCTGYYNYDQGFLPEFTNIQQFSGQLIHPQHWPEKLDYQHKKIIIIGSGATAITLVPNLVKGGAGHVTMLQRSPTYIASISAVDTTYTKLHKYLPVEMLYKIIRSRNIAMQRAVYALAQKSPKLFKKILLKSTKKLLKNAEDLQHFSPSYNPWDQRLCVVPDGDLFKVLNSGQASVETANIQKFVANGIQLEDDRILEADIVIAATGLNIQILGGIELTIDHQPVDVSKHMLYRGLMLNDIPNMVLMIGYINASWTLKIDIAAEYLCRLLNFMSEKQWNEVIAQGENEQILEDTVMGRLSSGYISRAASILPKQGKSEPWYVSNNYLYDRKMLKKAGFDDGILKFD